MRRETLCLPGPGAMGVGGDPPHPWALTPAIASCMREREPSIRRHRYSERVSKLTVASRTTSTVVAASPGQLDELARQLQSITGVTSSPQWQLRIRGLRDVEYEGWLVDLNDDVSLARMRGFDLWVGSRFRDSRRATIAVNAFGVLGDVHGESSAWASEAAARVKYQLGRIRPWWWWLRTPLGGAALGLFYLVVLGGVLWIARLARLVPEGTSSSGVLVIAVVLVSLFTQWFLIPTYVLGAGPTVKQWLGRGALAVLGIIVSTALGTWVAQLLPPSG